MPVESFAAPPRSRLTATHALPARSGALVTAALLLLNLLTLLLLARVIRERFAAFYFDDALMFYRYAYNLHHGNGIAWNPGGPPVYGLTSLLWLAVTWVCTLPWFALGQPDPVHLMIVLSGVTGGVLLLLLAVYCAWQTGGISWRPVALAFPVLALPLLLNTSFRNVMTNGMETMLASLLVLGFAAALFESFSRRTAGLAALTVLLGFLLVLTRPECLLIVVLLPLTYRALLGSREDTGTTVSIVAASLTLAAGELLLNHVYFGTAVPLAFYIKWKHGYLGFRPPLNPLTFVSYFMTVASLPVCVIALFAQRHHRRMLLVFGLPIAAVFLYLMSVMQIMGYPGRYYMPLLPLLMMPAILVTRDSYRDGSYRRLSMPVSRAVSLLLVYLLTSGQCGINVYDQLATLFHRQPALYAPPVFHVDSPVALPDIGWLVSCREVGQVAGQLPRGTVISASEVGILGALAPQVVIIDSAGLNDPYLALHGFSSRYILAQKPDLIWLVHPDYSRDYGLFVSDPELLKQYTLYAQVFQFGLAVRKDSAHYAQIMALLTRTWARLYPGYDMNAFLVQGVDWNPTPEPSTTWWDRFHAALRRPHRL